MAFSLAPGATLKAVRGTEEPVLRSLIGRTWCAASIPARRRVAIVLTRRMNGPGVKCYCNDYKQLKYGQSFLCKIRNERNFRARRLESAQVAVNVCSMLLSNVEWVT